jgi:hypothetical protein
VSTRKEIAVIRNYKYEPDACARALELLLKASVRKEGGPATAPKDDVKESNGYVATPSIPE